MKFFVIIVLMIWTSLVFPADFVKSEKLTLNAEDIRTMYVDCGAGFLKIEGVAGLDVIEVEAQIRIDRASEKEVTRILEEHLELSLTKRGSRAILESGFEHKSSLFSRIFNGGVNAAIDLTVKVPEEINMEVDDGSGFCEIQNLRGGVEIDDGSGDLTIRKITGDIFIDDGSGDLVIENITGDVRLDDGSGSLEIRHVKGNVYVDDGSGSIDIVDVQGDVTIEDAGSGGVDIRDVTGIVNRDDD